MRLLIISALLLLPTILKAELRFAGVLGNSGDSGDFLASFSAKAVAGIGPVLDRENTIWERAGSTQLNRYALDGRLLASFELPDSNNRLRDRMTLAGDHLLFHFRRDIYRLPLNAEPGSKPERLSVNADVMSSSSFDGRVLIVDAGEVFWFDPEIIERESVLKTDLSLRELSVDDEGTIYGFTGDKVYAWRAGQLLKTFPRPFHASRTQKIGDYWYSHGYHGTIHRFNDQFEPEPGVVLGGASGSFIGYLPRSVDITHGTGLVHVRDDLFAVSGFEGVVQLLKWQEAESKFAVVRRLGSLRGLKALALDVDGKVWTPRGSLRWSDSSTSPFTLGDVQPYHTTQPVVLGGKTICLLKNHYGNIQKAHGPFIDASGWAHLEARGIKGVTIDESIRASCAFMNSRGQLRLLVTSVDGKAMDFGLSESGHIGDNPTSVSLPGLKQCTSLAWFDGHVVAADGGVIRVFQQAQDGWRETRTRSLTLRAEQQGQQGDRAAKLDSESQATIAFVHSDGQRLAVTDSSNGQVHLYDSSKSDPIATYDGLIQPTHVAVSDNRVIVYEAGRQRLVKLEISSNGSQSPSDRKTFNRREDARGTLIWNFADADYYSLGRPGGLPLSVAMRERDGGLDLSFRIPDKTLEFKAGIANKSDSFLVTGSNARIPTDDWSELRLAVFVRRSDQQERFGFLGHLPIHASFSTDPNDWAPFDLQNYREVVAERKEQIRIEFEQPVDGKASLVIENEAGERVRNLVSGRSFRAGRNSVVWDGLDESGKLVAPGKYQWRGISHPGVRPEFKTFFADGGEGINAGGRPWGTNHGLLQHAVSDDRHIYFAAPVTEGGWAIMALDADGNFVQGYEHQQGFGIGHNAIAVDEKYLYCAQDGFGWGGTRGVDFTSKDWKATWTLTVARYDLKTGKVVEFPGKRRAFEADTMVVGPGSDHPELKDYNLGGIAVFKDRIYVGCRSENAVLVFNPENGERLESIAIKGVRHLAAGPDSVYAATDSGVVRLSDNKPILRSGIRQNSRRVRNSGESHYNIAGLTVGPNGNLWISDANSHQVHEYNLSGKRLSTVGNPGGPYRGTYDRDRMVEPAGLAFGPDGKLWVTEKRWNPKRILAWDAQLDSVVYEKVGMPHYGGDGSGFDPENPRRWIGLGCFWDVDVETGKAEPTHIFADDEAHFETYHPHSYSFFRESGRTFLVARGKIALISEVFEDGTIRDIAAACGTHHFAYGCRWNPPQAYIDAFYERWPEKRAEERPGRKGDGKPWAGRVAGVMWVDRNADGLPQKDEFSFTEEGVKFADGAWGHMQNSLTYRFPTAIGEQVMIVEIAPRGFLENSIPDYPTLQDAVNRSSTNIDLGPGYKRHGVATSSDRFGRFILLSDPEMNAYGRDGRHLWEFPNQWSNVHGSHKAPLPETGVIQGAMAILGMAEFDDQADVFFLNGNHGRCFLLTSDGIYLDEAFTDVRVSYAKNNLRLGGEIFGGTFNRSATDGHYYVQIGHGPYRIYQLHGLDKATRLSGSITATPPQIAAAERRNLREASENQVARTVQLPATLKWDQNGRFKVELQASVTDEHLHLTWQVQDPSPWINNGRDWTTLFATGDTVDLQIGTNPDADPARRKSVAGDKRLLIAPHAGKQPIAVLYEYIKPGGTNPIEFTSPWRGARVDNVTELKDVDIKVKTSNSSYLVEASIPLKTLGLTPTDRPIQTDFGVTFGDAAGTETQLRSYWSNPATMLVDDIPGEVMLHPNLWGQMHTESNPR